MYNLEVSDPETTASYRSSKKILENEVLFDFLSNKVWTAAVIFAVAEKKVLLAR